MSFFNKKIIDFSDNAFGLDLSDLSVKVVQMEDSGKDLCIRSFGSERIPLGSVSDGEIIDSKKVVDAIRRAIKKSGPKKINTKKVICSLPETKAFLRIINIPKINPDEVREAIKWEIEANIPVALDQVYYDWQALEEKLGTDMENKMSILVVAVSRKTINQFIDVLEAAGLEVIGLEIESVAQSRSLLRKEEQKNTILAVDLGDRRTSISIAHNGIPCFTSSNPVSGQSLSGVIAKNLNISFDEAEKIKIAKGIGSFVKEDAIFLAVKPVIENLISEIEKSFDFYLAGLRYSKTVNQVIICGGGANTRGLVPYLSKRLGKEVKIGSPWITADLKNKIPIMNKEESVHYTTAIGLALMNYISY
ncbi:MAG: pilus assembly protein PilM [Candidatus Moranbacteria bacterium]|jgi:type IV pilus assembly protein PilM|nr:pilus assembly protein PilM [Candidatus Moranbacteria bacterium]